MRVPFILRVRVAGNGGGGFSHSEPYACDYGGCSAMRAARKGVLGSMGSALQLGLCADLRVACRLSYRRDARCILLGSARGKFWHWGAPFLATCYGDA